MDKASTRIFKNPFSSLFCDMLSVPGKHDRQIANYLIGRPNSASVVEPGFIRICKDCAISIIQNVPPELAEYISVPEGKVLVDAAELEELKTELAELKTMQESQPQEEQPTHAAAEIATEILYSRGRKSSDMAKKGKRG